MTERADHVIHIRSLEEYIEVIEYFLSKGLYWVSGCQDVLECNWGVYKENTCIIIRGHSISYGNFYNHMDDGVPITYIEDIPIDGYKTILDKYFI